VALAQTAPRTGLAGAQTVWREVVGDAIADAAEPVEERDGVLTVRCHSATWAEELALMETELLKRLEERMGGSSPRSLKVLAG
jgi:predicted nucleic acid-binding Zn ribbon protein